MKASIQNLIQEKTAVVIEEDELESRNMSALESRSPRAASQESNSDEEKLKFWLFRRKNVLAIILTEDKNLVHSVIQTRHLRLPKCGDARHLYYTRHQHFRLELCASWSFSGKRKRILDLKFEQEAQTHCKVFRPVGTEKVD